MTTTRLEARDEQPYASIRTQATLLEWGSVNDLAAEVAEWLAKQGVETTAPVVYRYWKSGDAEVQYDVEVGWLTERAVDGNGRVCAGVIPAGTYLTATHVGHPDNLPETFDGMMEWADENTVSPATHLDGDRVVWEGWFEVFMTDPELEPDLNKWHVDMLILTHERNG